MNDQINNSVEKKELEIDLIELFRKLWVQRWFIVIACCIGGVIGILIANSIPKVYTTTVILVPETNARNTGNVNALAALAGVNIQQSASDMPVNLYPNIVKSTPFLLGLLDLQVVDRKQKIDTTIYSYLKDHQRRPWWNSVRSFVFGFPYKVLSLFRSNSNNGLIVESKRTSIPPKIISLTGEQRGVLGALKNSMNVTVEKSGVITLTATLQSAEISARLVDTLASYLQDYIINFRTEKARQDLASTQKLYDECQQNYFQAQQVYADYKDRHQNTVSEVFRTTEQRLQNDMNLTYTIYNQIAQQLQMAKIKVQDLTPVCKIIQPAVVPSGPSAPKKSTILMGFVVFSFICVCAWILLGKEFMHLFKSAD